MNYMKCNNCDRSDMFYDDYENGCIVCTNCAFVYSDQIFSCYNKNSCGFGFAQSSSSTSNEQIKFNPILHKCLDLLQEKCDAYNLPSQVYYTASRLIADNTEGLKPKTYNVFTAFWLYKSLQKHNVIRAKNEICHMFKCSPKEFTKIANEVDYDTIQIDTTKPSDILPRIQFDFHIPYKLKCYIGETADKLFETVNETQRAVLGYVIYKVVNENIDTLNVKKFPYTIPANMCGVSKASIKRLARD